MHTASGRIAEHVAVHIAIETFLYFDYARYATNLTFQQGNWSSSSVSEGKIHYSGKQNLYGFKVEFSVLPSGLAIGCTSHYSGSVEDLKVLKKNKDFHEKS